MMKKLKEKTGTKIQVVQDEAESQSYIVFKGTKTQNEKAQLELQKLFNDSYYCKHKPKKRIRKEYLDAIEQVCKDKFKVVIRASPNEIEIKG